MGFFLYNGLCPEKVAEKGRIPVLGDNRTSWRTVHPGIQKGAIANVQSKRGNVTQRLGSRSQLPGLALEMAESSEPSIADLVDGPTSVWLQKGT